MRDGALEISGGLVELLLKCCDHIGLLIAAVPNGNGELDAAQAADGDALLAMLRRMLGAEPAEAAVPAMHEAGVACSGGGPLDGDCWHISLAFGRDVLKNGMDPISFIRYLSTIGDIVSVVTNDSALPELGAMDPASCYLAFSIEF